MTERVHQQPFEFDSQAHAFDQRAGLSEQACRDIACLLLSLRPASVDGVLLEMAAGTGQLGLRLAEQDPFYVGIDVSAPMLDEFRARAAGSTPPIAPRLIHADGNAPWPLGDGSVRLCFMSRAAHLFDAEHLRGELLRVACATGSVVALGRIERHPDDVRAQLRREMRRRLRDAGHVTRGGGNRELLRALSLSDHAPITSHVAAMLDVETTLQRMLDSWRGKSGIAGAAIDADDKARLLDDLADWAQRELGDLQQRRVCSERYVIESQRIEGAA